MYETRTLSRNTPVYKGNDTATDMMFAQYKCYEMLAWARVDVGQIKPLVIRDKPREAPSVIVQTCNHESRKCGQPDYFTAAHWCCVQYFEPLIRPSLNSRLSANFYTRN